MEQYSVYKHINKINGKQYIGITKQTPENRWGTNGRNYRNKCPHFWNAIQKYGWDNFDHIIVANGLSKDAACEMEIELITKNKTQDRNYGYNTLSGGTSPKLTEEVRAKMSASMMGNKNGLGHPCSEEKKKKISDSQIGRKLTEEHKKKLSEAKLGKPHKSPSKETCKKISESHKKTPVYCEETDAIYPSVHECARQLNLWATLISKCCRGKLKSTGGYHLKYYQNDTQ